MPVRFCIQLFNYTVGRGCVLRRTPAPQGEAELLNRAFGIRKNLQGFFEFIFSLFFDIKIQQNMEIKYFFI